jgi:hypothetical protein
VLSHTSCFRRPVGRLLGALGLAVALTACASGAAQTPSTPEPTTVVVTPADDAADPEQVQRPARHEVSCIDRTSSLPAWFVERSLHHVARRVEDAVTGPMQPAVFYLRSMSANSYAPEAEIATVELSAVPTAPRAPIGSTNPFLKEEDRKRREAYERDHATWLAGLAATRTVAKAAAGRIRALTLTVDNVGTDVLGCVLRAPDLMDGADERSLFLASDLVAEGRQQDSVPPAGSLDGVHVTVGFYCADLASVCTARVTAFVGLLQQAGADDVSVLDPQNLTE